MKNMCSCVKIRKDKGPKLVKQTYYDVLHEYNNMQVSSLGSSPKHIWMSNPHQQKASQHPLWNMYKVFA